jgi:ribonuclease Z
MTWLVQPRLINEPFADPGLYLDFLFARRAILFDLGDLSPLSSREIMRVSHAFVSHTHMDHFAGFDQLLRLCLHRAGPLHLTGPPGFAERVAAKLAGYTWNLLDETSVDFVIVADEFDGRVRRRVRFAAREAFARREVEPPALPEGCLLAEDQFRIEAVTLDHGTPCLGFALQERLRVNVVREGLAALALPVGPWLNAAKAAVRRGDDDTTRFAVDAERSVDLATLKRQALHVGPGQRVAYLVDMAGHPENIAGAVRLATGAHQLFIEAPFLEEDADIAQARRHLTAARAGEIARRAGVRQVVPLHFSPRYLDRPEALADEVARAFSGGARRDCTG